MSVLTAIEFHPLARIRALVALVVIALTVSPFVEAAAQWPVGEASANAYLFAQPNSSSTPGGINCSSNNSGLGARAASIACSPSTPNELLTGSYTATASASAIAGGGLRGQAHFQGTVRVGYVYFNDVVASYYDQVTISPLGSALPSLVRFNFSLDGSAAYSTNPSMGIGNDGNGYSFASYLEFRTFPSPGRQPTSTIYHDGKQSMVNGFMDVPFTDFTSGALTYSLLMAVINRVYTSNSQLADGTPVDIIRDSDYSHTGQLQPLQVFDASGVDITDDMSIQYASAPVQTVPEPGATVLLATGLVGVAAVRRRTANRRGA